MDWQEVHKENVSVFMYMGFFFKILGQKTSKNYAKTTNLFKIAQEKFI
jgi:hypothetical protein